MLRKNIVIPHKESRISKRSMHGGGYMFGSQRQINRRSHNFVVKGGSDFPFKEMIIARFFKNLLGY